MCEPIEEHSREIGRDDQVVEEVSRRLELASPAGEIREEGLEALLRRLAEDRIRLEPRILEEVSIALEGTLRKAGPEKAERLFERAIAANIQDCRLRHLYALSFPIIRSGGFAPRQARSGTKPVIGRDLPKKTVPRLQPSSRSTGVSAGRTARAASMQGTG